MNPRGSLIQASNGVLYGMTWKGGVDNYGVIFSYDISTNTFTKLMDFNGANGTNPEGNLIQINNNLLYGLTNGGGYNGNGVIFSYDISNNIYSNVHDFLNINGAWPTGTLLKSSNGLLYGMTERGGINNVGAIFHFNTSSNSYTKIHDFDYNSSGGYPHGNLMQASDGKLYGMSNLGGTKNAGTIFNIDILIDSFNVIFNFDTANNIGSYPFGDLIELNPTLNNVQSESQIDWLTISPNPTSNNITLFSSKNINEIKVRDVLGQTITPSAFPIGTHSSGISPTGEKTTLDVSTLENGIYFITITSGKESSTQKLIVQH